MKYILFSICIFVLGGCTMNSSTDAKTNEQSDDVNIKIETIKNQLVQIEIELVEKEQEINELQEQLEFINYRDDSRINTINNMTHMNEQIIERLPDVTHKQGYVKEIIENKDRVFLIVDFATWEKDLDAPNNGILINEIEEKVKIQVTGDFDAVYILENALLAYQPFADFIQGEHTGLYHFYLVEDEIVLIKEQLLP